MDGLDRTHGVRPRRSAAALGEAWPGVEMEQHSADLEECGGLDMSTDKNASRIQQGVTYRGQAPSGDKRSIEELARAVGERLRERGWQALPESTDSDDRSVRLYREGVKGAHLYAANGQLVFTGEVRG
ncbi:hypothetical protein ACFVVJ_25485 [Streptomyces albidoflavus]